MPISRHAKPKGYGKSQTQTNSVLAFEDVRELLDEVSLFLYEVTDYTTDLPRPKGASSFSSIKPTVTPWAARMWPKVEP